MKTRHTAGAVGLAVATATAAAVLASAGSSPSSHQAVADAGSRPAFANSFGVLRDTSDQPVSPAANPYKRDGALLHVNPNSARFAGVVADQSVWIASSTDGKMCIDAIASDGQGGGCGVGTLAAADGFFTEGQPAPATVESEGLPPDTTDLIGLVPDGVRTVVVTLADAETTLRAHGNIVGARLSGKPTSVRFLDADGVQHVTRLGGE